MVSVHSPLKATRPNQAPAPSQPTRINDLVPNGRYSGHGSVHGTASGQPANPVIAGTALTRVLDDPAVGARRMQFSPGDEIMASENAATHVFLIHRGQVRLYQEGQPTGTAAQQQQSVRLIDVLGRDQWFGVAALAKADRYDCRAIAVTPTIISEIPADKLLPALMRRPEAMAEVTRDLARSVMAAHAETSRLMFDDCSRRLIDALVRLSTSAAATQREDGVVLHMTHSQLAQAVGAARETVSLALTQLRLQNLIRTGRNQLFFNPENLRRVQQASGDSQASDRGIAD